MNDEKQMRKIYFLVGVALIVACGLEIIAIFLQDGIKGFSFTHIEMLILYLLGCVAIMFGMVASHIKEIKASIDPNEVRRLE